MRDQGWPTSSRQAKSATRVLLGEVIQGQAFGCFKRALTPMTASAAHKALAYVATRVNAAVPFYGGGIHTQLDRASDITCPTQFHYAKHDDNIPLSAVDQVRQAMTGLPAELHLYPGAHHGFNYWARGSYHAESAALAHGRALVFLAQHLF